MNEVNQLLGGLGDALRALAAQFTSIWLPIQLAVLLVAALVAAAVATIVRRRVDLLSLTMGWPAYARLLVRTLAANLGLIVFIVAVGLSRVALESAGWPRHDYLLGVAANLATAWVVIALLASLIRNRFLYRLIAVCAWTIAALSIVGLLRPLMVALDSVAVTFGGLRVSPLLLIKAAALLLIALWAASAASNVIERRMRDAVDLTPSLRVLLGKLVRFALIAIAIVVALNSVGIDLSALALFSGAVGVGIGFGLQKIVANFFSGIILLADKSIKPGDVISVGDSFGWVGAMNARYTSVVTRDGREFLIPNEDLVTERVVNWSHSNRRVRLDVPFGVSYGSDPHRVLSLAITAAASVPRILESPAPVCHMTAFGDSSLDFLLRFWIDDPIDGVTNVRGLALLALWDAFKREGIEIPFPQRDLNLRSPVHVKIDPGEAQ